MRCSAICLPSSSSRKASSSAGSVGPCSCADGVATAVAAGTLCAWAVADPATDRSIAPVTDAARSFLLVSRMLTRPPFSASAARTTWAASPGAPRLRQAQDDPEDEEAEEHVLNRVDDDAHPRGAEAPAGERQKERVAEDVRRDAPGLVKVVEAEQHAVGRPAPPPED